MASNIDPTKPTAGNALTSDVRANFQHAKNEIEALQNGTGLADGAVTDAKIGVRTPDQSVTAVAGSGTLSQIINWFANIIKGISGETNWYDAPGTTLKSHVANVSNPHQVTAAQVGFTDALTGKTAPVDADLIPILDSAGTPAFVLKKLTWANLKASMLSYLDQFFATPFDNPWSYSGEFIVDQQAVPGTAYTVVAGAAAAYTIDGWLVSCTGANVQAQRVQLADGEYALQITGAAGVTNVDLYSRVEGFDAQHFTNVVSNILISMSNSLSLPVTWTLAYANALDNFGAVTTISTGTFNTTASLTRFNAAIAASANIKNGMQLQLHVGAQTSGTWQLTDLDHLTGTTERAYPHRNYVDVLARCQRYYWYVPSIHIGYTTSNTYCYNGQLAFPITMKNVPTIVAGANYTVGAGAAGTPAIAAGAGYAAGVDGVCLYNSAANWNINTPVAFTGAFNARL